MQLVLESTFTTTTLDTPLPKAHEQLQMAFKNHKVATPKRCGGLQPLAASEEEADEYSNVNGRAHKEDGYIFGWHIDLVISDRFPSVMMASDESHRQYVVPVRAQCLSFGAYLPLCLSVACVCGAISSSLLPHRFC